MVEGQGDYPLTGLGSDSAELVESIDGDEGNGVVVAVGVEGKAKVSQSWLPIDIPSLSNSIVRHYDYIGHRQRGDRVMGGSCV
ncbi:hypothetical protein [Nocardia sp. NPDC050793]|uniref:hypothetical protein n=1 Tax=Nocardia sp. NPDC050793 TaxID=3155159 RepID=UPI0033E547C1